MIGLGSPYPRREPTIPLVAGPDRGPLRNLGGRARPARHHPDPPTPIAHGTPPAVRRTIGPRPQPLPADLGRPALGRPRRRAPAAVFLPRSIPSTAICIGSAPHPFRGPVSLAL